MSKHYGQTLERIVRRNNYSISELARLAKVNRRSVYNWFNQENLRAEIILKVGCALRYDFSSEFPELFSPDDFRRAFQQKGSVLTERLEEEKKEIHYWKDKYLSLLEEYNKALMRRIEKVGSHL